MKPKNSQVVLLQLSIFLLAMKSGRGNHNGKSSNGGSPNGQPPSGDSGQYPYYGDIQNPGAGQSYDYTYDASPQEIQCYSCTYHVRSGNAAGHSNCRDPFLPSGITKTACVGACAKIYHKTSETEYTVTRICLPNCKDVRDEKGYTQCCYGHLCNSGGKTLSPLPLLIVTALLALVAIR